MSLSEWVECRPARTLSSPDDRADDEVVIPACRALDE